MRVGGNHTCSIWCDFLFDLLQQQYFMSHTLYSEYIWNRKRTKLKRIDLYKSRVHTSNAVRREANDCLAHQLRVHMRNKHTRYTEQQQQQQKHVVRVMLWSVDLVSSTTACHDASDCLTRLLSCVTAVIAPEMGNYTPGTRYDILVPSI